MNFDAVRDYAFRPGEDSGPGPPLLIAEPTCQSCIDYAALTEWRGIYSVPVVNALRRLVNEWDLIDWRNGSLKIARIPFW
jgi:hypothetical protein